MIQVILAASVVFIGLFLAPVYGGDPRVPEGTGVAALGALLVVGICAITTGHWPQRRHGGALLAVLAFTAWVAVTVLWTPSVDHGTEKLWDLILKALPLFVFCLLIAGRSPSTVALVLVAGALLVTTDAMMAWIATPEGRGVKLGYLVAHADAHYTEVGGAHYQRINRSIGLGALVLLAYALIGRGRAAWAGAAGGMGLVAIMLLIGGRGPVVAIGAAVLVVAALSPLARWRGALLVALTGGAVLLVGWENLTTFARLAAGDAERLSMYEAAAGWWSEAPVLGQGFGAYTPLAAPGQTGQYWPHNIVIEIGMETGLVGLVLAGAVLWTCIRRIPAPCHPLDLVPVMLLAAAIVNAMFSQSLPGNIELWCALGLITGWQWQQAQPLPVRRHAAPILAPRGGAQPQAQS